MPTPVLPTVILPSSQEFGLVANTRIFSSTFNQSVQRVEQPGIRWRATYTYDLLGDANARLFKSFLAQVRGRANKFWARDFAFVGQADVGGLACAGTIGQTTATLSSSLTLSEGDYIALGTELKLITADSTGTAISFEPPLYDDHTSSSVITATPAAYMILDQDSVNWKTQPPNISSLSFSATEILE